MEPSVLDGSSYGEHADMSYEELEELTRPDSPEIDLEQADRI